MPIVSIRDVMTMKAVKSAIVFLILICLGFALISCSKAGSPIEPDSAANIISDVPDSFDAQSESRHVIGAYQVTIDPDFQTLSISPVKRTGSFHYELTQDYPEVLTITAWGFTPNFWADIKLSHPLPVSGVDVFDPRVVAILPANDGVSVHFPTLDCNANNSVFVKPDGYTKLWDNPSIPGNANPFIAYFKEQPYHQWSSINPQDQTKRWKMDIDGFGGALTFELVVDISTNYPDEPYPYIDNVEEPFQIDLLIGLGLTDEGGSASVNAIISDWQGEPTIGGVSIEAPDLFEDIVNLDFVEQIDTFDYKYTGTISNDLIVSSGEYPVLVSSWDADTGIRAYNMFNANVAHSGLFNMQDVTPAFSCCSHGDFSIYGDYAFVVGKEYLTNDQVLLRYDVSDITNPRFISKIETYNEPVAVEVSGNYLYLISEYQYNDTRLYVLDISNPLAPSFVTSIDMDKNISKLKVIDNYLYAMYSYGILLIDISTPASACVISQIRSKAEDFEVADGYLYIMGDWRLKIYEYESPYHVRWIKSVWDRVQRGDFCISDGYAYVRDSESDCLNIIDIDPPEEASIVNTFDGLPDGSYNYSNSMVTRGDYLYFLAAQTYYEIPAGLYIYNISDRENPLLACSLPITDSWYSALTNNIEFLDDYLMFSSDEGLRVVDISSPESAYFVNKISNLGRAKEAYPDGDYLYLASTIGLQILDISTPENAFLVKTIASPDAWDVRAKDGYAYLADNDLGLMIIDVDPVEDAHVINTIEIPVNARDVAIDGNYLYVCGGLSIIDIADPENAQLITSISQIGIAHDVEAADGYAYVIQWPYGLHIVDIDPPESAFVAGSLDMNDPMGVDVLGNYAYVADRDEGIEAVRISNPSEPFIVDSIHMYDVRDVIISDGYLYASDGYSRNGSLIIVDISSPGNMNIVDNYDLDLGVAHTNVQDNYAYLAANFDLKIIKLW